jgi:ABC-type uncharacterized transport system ATPase subunit
MTAPATVAGRPGLSPTDGPDTSLAAPLLRAEGITKSFGGVVANADISLTLEEGEIHAVVGENGAGKTTLMNILYGLYQPDAGSLFLRGRRVTIQRPRDAIRLGFGLVSQHFLLVERHTVAENLALALPQLGFSFSAQRIARELEPLARQFGLELDIHAQVARLSPGQRQRLEIAKALLRRSKILILDEPTSVLTPQEAEDLFHVLRQLRLSGCGIIFISHKLDDVLAVSDRISVLRRGRLVLTSPGAGADKAALSLAMVGREVAVPVKAPCPPDRPIALRVECLRLKRDAQPVAFAIGKGEILGIAGVAGNGQGELAEALTGLTRVRGARIELNGKNLAGQGAAQFRAEGIAHIPEDRNRMGIVPSMSVEENFALRWLDAPEFHRGPFILRGQIHQRALELIERYRISAPSLQSRTSLLSGGNVQRVILAREFSDPPQLIVAVHPTYGLDVQAIAQVHQALLDQAARGTAILLISEDLDELLALADRIAVLYEKRIIGLVDRAAVKVEQLGLLMVGQAA